ncbi:MAG: hypothetical protein ABIW32_08505 [Terrimesophilobacter sp.]
MSFLPGWLIIAIIVILVILGAVIALVVVPQRKGEGTNESRPALMLVVARFLALLYAGLMTIGTVVNAIVMLVSDTVSVSLPVRQFWPEVYPWITLQPAPAASVVGGGFTTADVMVDGLGMDARLILAAGGVVQGVTLIVIACVIALLCHRLLGGSPFRGLLARSTTWAAAAIAIGGIAWQFLFEIGGSIASSQVLQLNGWNSTPTSTEMSDYVDTHFDPFATGLPESAFGFHLDFWPLLIGLALAAVAVAFRYSERLQKDTDGLV